MIIPTRNEAASLPALLADLKAQQGVDPRLTVVDGGSTDATVALAQRAGAEVRQSPPGRGQQLNAGWRGQDEDWLLFLHADSLLPDPWLLARALRATRAWPARTAGHFALEFIHTPWPKPRFYAHLEAKSALNRPQCFNGDQGLLIRRSFLDRLGGFDESLPFLEDQALGARIHAQGQWRTLPGHLQTSARRFETEGRGARYAAMFLIMCAREVDARDYLAGLPALYREQSEAGPLRLRPLARALLTRLQAEPQSWERLAEYTLRNAWQPVALADTLAGREGDWLRAYARTLEPWLLEADALRAPMALALRGLGGLLGRSLLRPE